MEVSNIDQVLKLHLFQISCYHRLVYNILLGTEKGKTRQKLFNYHSHLMIKALVHDHNSSHVISTPVM